MSQDIVIGLLDGEADSRRTFVQRYGPKVYAFVLDVVGNKEDAEELTQDVLVKAIKKIRRYDPAKASLATWLLRIAHNVVVSHLRMSLPPTQSIDDLGELPAGETADDTRVDILRRAVAMLPVSERALIHMHYYDNIAMPEIAYALGLNEGTVAVKLYRVRAKLKKLIEQQYGKL